MTDTLLSPVGHARERAGVVGDRQLVCVQTFYISRLTSHPIVLVPGTFVAVTGRGPKGDSNGSGKTSFLAAVSLLLGDREWRLAGGAKAPTALLFDARATGGAIGGERYESAGHGYVIGVFADPDDPAATALTIWCRIDTTTPYLTVRWTEGVRLVELDSDREAHEVADRTWGGLPHHDSGFDTYARRLYGETPRCLAYVQQRGEKRNPPSLLQMHAGEFSPEQIGDSLIRLAGLRHLLDEELEHRKRLADAEARLDERRDEDQEAFEREELALAEVWKRNEAREFADHARRHWRLHYAKGLLDVLDEQARFDRELADARSRADDARAAERQATRALDELRDSAALADGAERARLAYDRCDAAWQEAKDRARDLGAERRRAVERRNELQEAARGARGVAIDDALRRVDAAERARDAATGALAIATNEEQTAASTVNAVEGGGDGLAGAVLGALRSAGVGADRLVDAIDVADDSRSFWEPLLAPYADAIVIDESDLTTALGAVGFLPGSVLVAGRGGGLSLPEGVRAAPMLARRFLGGLAARAVAATAPDRAVDAELGVHLVGGFASPVLGRDARLAAARAALGDTRGRLVAAQSRGELADAELDVARRDLESSEAAAALPAIGATIERLDRESVEAAAVVDERAVAARAADDARQRALGQLHAHGQLLTAAEGEVARAGAARAAVDDDVGRLEYGRGRLAVDYWGQGWGEGADAARRALADEPRGEKRLRKEASEALKRALWTLGVHGEHGIAPTEELAQTVQRRYQQLDDEESAESGAGFEEVARALGDYLDAWADQDALTEATVAEDRARRAKELEVVTRSADEVRHGHEQVQQATAELIEGALADIGSELDRLRRADGDYGADLVVESCPPEGATGLWQWRVVPRWRRAPGGPLVRYDTRANTAQEKLFTVHLVLAALLAAPNPRGRVLVLDELGDSLGDEHRRAVLRAIGVTAARTGITVLGTCQDSVLVDAAQECGEILYFEHTSDTDVLNRPARMFGHDPAGARVELTADAATWGRPPV
ncbi:MAG: hypothetical protein ACT4PI_19045 [Actinomycetota bacterium]